jgi:hypothetical protein
MLGFHILTLYLEQIINTKELYDSHTKILLFISGYIIVYEMVVYFNAFNEDKK